MSNTKSPQPLDRKMSKDEFQRIEVQGLHNALRFLARECRTLGYTSTASLAQNAATTIFLELAAGRECGAGAKEKKTLKPVRSYPRRPSLPTGMGEAIGKSNGRKA